MKFFKTNEMITEANWLCIFNDSTSEFPQKKTNLDLIKYQIS